MDLLRPGHTADATVAGGKGSNLLTLAKASYNIPHFVVISQEALSRLSKLDEPDKNRALDSLVASALAEFKPSTLFAVRSSACSEDGASHSFAGQFRTVLNVDEQHLGNAIIDVYHSAVQTGNDTYKAFAGINTIASAVIVQEMVPATASGVAFGMNPLNGDANTIVINAAKGLGEKLVSGEINADTYTLIKSANTYHNETTAEAPVLKNAQTKLVADLVRQVEQTFGVPQDIEFAFSGDELFLLQSRPITTRGQARTIWDNSNIVESYPGISLPLTCSFLDKVYGAVYRQLCAVLGVSQKNISANKELFDNLLGFVNGRVYYNLNSWFGILALLPGYRLNAAFMEKMMGVKDKPQFDVEEKEAARSFGDYLNVLNALRCIITNLRTANKQRLAFLQDFDSVYNRFSNIDHDTLSAEQIWNNYSSFEKLMVERWKAPLVNDFFTMIYFGVLQKLCAKYLPAEPNACNELIASSKDIITTEPAKQLPRLAAMIRNNTALAKVFSEHTATDVWQTLRSNPGFNSEYQAINNYINTWGERSVAELKLETLTYKQQPQLLIGVLQSYLANSVFDFYENKGAEDLRAKTEAKMLVQLRRHPLQRVIFKHVLKKARYFITNRENLRFYRTKGFGLVRQMMIALGKKLAEQLRLDDSRDIFYLKLDEIKNVIDSKDNSAITSVAKTKEQYRLFEKMPAQERIVTVAREKYFTYPVTQTNETAGRITTLQGIPCSPGIVQARVRLVTHAGSLNVLNGDIMATYATDPGWVVLFPSSAGILTERGSLLSHAAIVSREMGIPCIVGISGLMQQLKDGDNIIMDGSTGIVNLLAD